MANPDERLMLQSLITTMKPLKTNVFYRGNRTRTQVYVGLAVLLGTVLMVYSVFFTGLVDGSTSGRVLWWFGLGLIMAGIVGGVVWTRKRAA